MILPRLYPILDTSRVSDIADAAQAMLDGGASIIQIRHKGLWTRETFAAAERVAIVSSSLIVNDRPDIARLLGAGVHVGQTDLPPREARTIVGDGVIGFSTHNREQLLAAQEEPIDYLALGPVFGTASKVNPDPIVGLETLRELRSLTGKPLVAIGGITRANAREALEAGADSVAVIGDLYPDPPTPLALRARIEGWLELLQT